MLLDILSRYAQNIPEIAPHGENSTVENNGIEILQSPRERQRRIGFRHLSFPDRAMFGDVLGALHEPDRVRHLWSGCPTRRKGKPSSIAAVAVEIVRLARVEGTK